MDVIILTCYSMPTYWNEISELTYENESTKTIYGISSSNYIKNVSFVKNVFVYVVFALNKEM